MSTNRRGTSVTIGPPAAALLSVSGGLGTTAAPVAFASGSRLDATGVAGRAATDEARAGIVNVAGGASTATPRSGHSTYRPAHPPQTTSRIPPYTPTNGQLWCWLPRGRPVI